jgi:multidrug efflux pump subunit AcrB
MAVGHDVVAAIGAQNLILPAGTQKIGPLEYFVKLNASPTQIEDLNNLPIRAHNGSVTYIRDVAHVRDGYAPQTSMVRLEGRRAVLMSVLKTGKASTIDIINSINEKLPQIRAALPPELKIEPLSDQSVFVRAAISGVIREALIAGALTGLLILLFLGSWRSTLIITISIPLSILASVYCLSALGETINIMTLGGLALAVGILVDDATVTIENINYHLEHGKDVETAILDGAHQIALPALVSTLSICIVFVPMFLLAGIAKFLFIPLAEAVVFAMLASYILSRTLVPTLAKFWLKPHDAAARHKPRNVLARISRAVRAGLRGHARQVSRPAEPGLAQRAALRGAVLGRHGGDRRARLSARAFARSRPGFLPLGGRRPDQAARARAHRHPHRGDGRAVRCDRGDDPRRHSGEAIEQHRRQPGVALQRHQSRVQHLGAGGPGRCRYIRESQRRPPPTADFVHLLRARLNADYPSTTFSFLPADMISQILNFGLPSPIDVQIVGFNVPANRAFANNLLQKLHGVAGAVDLHIHQSGDYPQFNVDVDRTKAQLVGLTEQAVAGNMLVSLSGSFQTAPSFWVDPKSGTQYQVATQTPQYRLENLNDLGNTPLSGGVGGSSQILSNLASIHRSSAPAVVSHYNATPAIDIYGSVQGADLGYVSAQINEIISAARKDLPKGSNVVLRGQSQTMKASFNGLLIGLIGAIVLVYMLIVVNFQSLLDPFIIITALPAALAGIVWMLFLTHTTVSVPALTGAIMCMGVATANSVLVVSFARERMNAGDNAFEAALEAGFTRLRPVLMTALAMIIGMIPMALGLGDGGEQNAPLGRAVIGGLIFATVATLIFVPTVFSIIHGRPSQHPIHSPEISHG